MVNFEKYIRKNVGNRNNANQTMEAPKVTKNIQHGGRK